MRMMSKISLIFILAFALMWVAQPAQTEVPDSIYANTNTAPSLPDQWTSNNLRGGKANAIALSPDFINDGVVYSGEYLSDYQGTSSGIGIAHSQDGGATWQNSYVSDLPYTSALYDVAVGGDGAVFAATGGGLFRNSDGGSGWTRILYDGAPGIVRKTAVSPHYPLTPHIMAAGGYGGLSVSHDDGATWTATSSRYVSDLAYADAETAFIAHFEGVDRTVDGGLTWTAVYTHPLNAITAISQTIIAGGNVGDLHISADGGTNWISHTIASDAGRVNAIAPSPQFDSDHTLFAGTSNGLYRSSDGGATWQKEMQTAVLSLAISPAWPTEPLLLVGTGDGIYRYDSASQTSVLSGGFAPLTARALVQSGDGALLLAGASNHGIYRSGDGGASWQPTGFQGGLTYYSITALAIADGGVQFAARGSGTGIGASIYRFSDGGTTWENVYNTDYVTNIAPSPAFASDGLVVATATSGGLMQSTDGGDNWALLSGWSGGWAQTVMVLENGRYLVGSSDGFWQSNDNGATWQQATSGLTDGRRVGHIAIAADGTLLASADWYEVGYTPRHTLFRSTDGGANWVETAVGWPNALVNDIAFETTESVYAVMETAVYHSTDGGQSWTTIGAPPDAEWLYRLLLRDGALLVSGSNGVWQHVGLWDQLLINSTFESVDSWTLPSTSIPPAYSDVQIHAGSFAMRIGLTETMTQTYGYSSARQTVTLPDDLLAARLHVWLYPIAESATTAGDLHYILLLDPTDNAVLATLYWDLSNEQAWQEMAFPIPSSLAGREVTLLFGVKNDGINGRSGLYVDDATLWVLDGDLLPHRHYLPLVLGG